MLKLSPVLYITQIQCCDTDSQRAIYRAYATAGLYDVRSTGVRCLLLQLTSVCGAGKLDGRLTQRDLLTSQHIAVKACSQHIN